MNKIMIIIAFLYSICCELGGDEKMLFDKTLCCNLKSTIGAAQASCPNSILIIHCLPD